MRLFGVLLLAVAVHAADVPLVSLTCGGEVEIFGDRPIGVKADLSKWVEVAKTAWKRLEERVQCHCPSLTNEQFHDRFDPVRVVLNLLPGKPSHEEDLPCLDDMAQYTRDLHKYLKSTFLGSEVTLPASCTRDAYIGDQGCAFSLDLSDTLGASLKVALASCPGSPIPSLGLWCSGEACSTLWTPCSAASDCSAGQKCAAGDALQSLFGGMDSVTALLGNFGLNVTGAVEHIVRVIDGDFNSDRSLEDCNAEFAAFPERVVAHLAPLFGKKGAVGMCVPSEWEGWGAAFEANMQRWEHMSSRPRKDDCAPLKKRQDSQFNWRRGQMTEIGQSGGGWCVGYDDCNFHQNAGDCESNDDFEYFMSKLYCKYKQPDSCRAYSPFCYWDEKSTEKYKCLFNKTTQHDGILEKEDWLRGLSCNPIEEVGSKCDAFKEPIFVCDHEYCACRGGKWDNTTKTCSGEKKQTCEAENTCWGVMQQCYEKAGEDSSYMRTAKECEDYFMCRCEKIASDLGCNTRDFCGRRCACMYTERDRFIGPHCDIRVIRGNEPTVVTYNADENPPVVEWDGTVNGKKVVEMLRSSATPVAPPSPSDKANPLVVLTCDGHLFLFPHTNIAVTLHFKGGAEVATAVAEAALPSFRCALDGIASDDTTAFEQLAKAYMVHLPHMWLSRFVLGEDSFAPKGSVADWLFNLTGKSEPDVPSLQELASLAQAEFSQPSVEIRGEGWLPYLTGWLASGVQSAVTALYRSARSVGLVPHDTWYKELFGLESMGEEERNEMIRKVLGDRHKALTEMARKKEGVKWGGRVKLPSGADTRGVTQVGLSVDLPNDMGTVEGFVRQCPKGKGFAEVQFGLGGRALESVAMSQYCSKDGDCREGEKCKAVNTRLFGSPMYSVDFLGGFLWGGNFTKGFIGKCPILSTTISQVSFETTSTDCVGLPRWVEDIAHVVSAFTHPNHFEKTKGEDQHGVVGWCHIPTSDIVNGIWQAASGDDETLDFSSARPLNSPPFTPKSSQGTDDEL